MDELGLDLLMNPRKRMSSSDSRSVSIIDDDVMSVKSITFGAPASRSNPHVVDIREMEAESIQEDLSFEEDSYDARPQPLKHSRPRPPPSADGGDSLQSQDMPPSVAAAPRMPYGMSEEEKLNAKREILYQFDRLEKKGMRLPRKFTLASSLEEMKTELDRIKRDRDIDQSIGFQRKVMMTACSGLELLNNYFDPVGAKLDGWSESINEHIDDYDDIFEELHEKHKGKMKMAPELKLLFMLGGSAFMFHTTNKLKSAFPGMEQILKTNPDLVKQFAAATANTMSQDKSNPMQSGLGGLFSNILGGGLFNSNPKAPTPAPGGQRPMRAPSNVEDILRELESEAGTVDNRIEILSTVSESEAVTADIADDASINQLLMNRKKKPARRKMTLDI